MRCCGCCIDSAEASFSFMRILENLPGIGHLVAAVYGCIGQRAKAERALIKASAGICFCPCQLPAEVFDEATRKRSPKVWSPALMPRLDWMREYHGHLLRNICLPGSHQSAGFKVHKKIHPIPLTTGWCKCQELSFTEQLNGGVRFLDLRVMNDPDKKGGELRLHHNVVTFITLIEVLERVRDFINANPSELVGLYMTNDGKELNYDKLNAEINRIIGSKVYTGDAFNATVGQIASTGKNVLLFGEGVNKSQRMNYRWPNKCWPKEIRADLKQYISEMANNARYSFFWYKAECTPNAAMVVRNLGGVPGLVAASCADEKFEFIEGLATSANYQVLEVLDESSQIPFNILSTDYVTDDIVGKIVDSNRNSQTAAFDATATSSATPPGGIDDEMVDKHALERGELPGQTQQTSVYCESSI